MGSHSSGPMREHPPASRAHAQPAFGERHVPEPWGASVSSLGSGGELRPLPDFLREKMEQSFQHDFSQVRLRLSEAPARIGARAVTRGDEITLPPRHYRPDSLSGQSLLGHELAHVVQQRTGRASSPGLAGRILDHSSLEAEADRQGEQAARGGRVTSARAEAYPARSSASASTALPFQPAWEFVDIGGREVKKNLRANTDGTFTLTSSGEVYQDTGKTHSSGSGARVLTPVSATTTTTTTPTITPGTATHDSKNVLFAVGESGKVEYLGNTAANRLAHAGKFWEASPENFTLFKNSGKRTGSPKVFDPVDLKRYAYDETGKQFYEWDRAKGNRRGTAVSTTKGPKGEPSPNDVLLDRLTKKELVDRRRDDRTSQDLLPFDVGPYTSHVTLTTDSDSKVQRTWHALSGTPAWLTGTAVNRDHIPSGESLNQRGDSSAYPQGFTITIPNPEMHQPFSPTYGSDNSLKTGMMDDNQGTSERRVYFDRDNPSAAAYRDITFMLTKTEGQDYSSSHAYLDLTKSSNRLRQVGGYRNLFHRNVQIHRKLGGKRGFDPKASGLAYTVGIRKPGKNKKKISKRAGAYTWTSVKGKTQGSLLAAAIEEALAQAGKFKRI